MLALMGDNFMSDGLERRTFKPGQIIFAQESFGDEAFIIEYGEVEIARGDGRTQLIVGMIGEGELLGEMALVDSEPHSATARAHTKTGCIVIPKRVFEKGLKTSNPIVISVLNTLLRRLRGETGNAAKRTLS